MTDPVEATGSTVDEAIERALEELGARDDEVEIQVLSEGGPKGILSRKVEPARVRVRFRDERSPEEIAAERVEERTDRPAREPADPELLDDQADAAEDFLNGLLDVWDVDGEARADVEGGAIHVRLEGPDMALLIGRHGSTLESLQELVRAAVQHGSRAHATMTLDIAGYRRRQQEILERRVRSLAAKVKRSGSPVELDPMNAYDRRVVHTALAGFDGVVTLSEGEGADRRVVIRPA